MDLDLTPEQRAFRDEVRTFIREKLPSEIRERLRAGHPPRKQDTVAWQRILNERGWAAPHWPKRYGGADLGPMERLILLDETYRAPAPLPQVLNVGMLGSKMRREKKRPSVSPEVTSISRPSTSLASAMPTAM